MQSQARKQFVLAVLSGLVVAAAVAASPAHAAEPCRLHRDFAVGSDPLLAAVRPADCATLLGNPPEFTWARPDGGASYTVALTFPDGHTEMRSTPQNWLAWDRPVPAGDYSWRVTTSGAVPRRSDARAFHVETGGALPAQPTVAVAGHHAAAASAASASPVFELESSPSWIPSVRSAGVGRKAATSGFFGGFTE